VLGHDGPDDLVLDLELVHLGEERLAEVPAAAPDRIEGLDLGPQRLDLLGRRPVQAGHLLDGRAEVAVLIDVADDLLGQLPVLGIEEGQGGLPVQMVPERGRPEIVFSSDTASLFSEKWGRKPSSR